MNNDEESLKKEAEAFNARIDERIAAGFIPDLRRAVHCDYFYKSFWRDPVFIQLYLGWIMDGLLDLLDRYCGKNLKILDVGCGAGYMSLELARNGHHVKAFDISSSCIKHAKQMLLENPYKTEFGSLKYKKHSFEESKTIYAGEKFDVILFSVSMHHLQNVQSVVDICHEILPEGGYLLFYEPCHDVFRVQDAAQVALIRGLLAITGHWYAPSEIRPHLEDKEKLLRYFHATHHEYIWERDKNEPEGQSPHDLEASGKEILAAARSRFKELEIRPGCSFIYRLLGGIRGSEAMTKELAEFITLYERVCVENGFLRENMFYFIGRK